MNHIVSLLLLWQVIDYWFYFCQNFSYLLDNLRTSELRIEVIINIQLDYILFLLLFPVIFHINPKQLHFCLNYSQVPHLNIIESYLLLRLLYFSYSFFVFFIEVFVLSILFAVSWSLFNLYLLKEGKILSFLYLNSIQDFGLLISIVNNFFEMLKMITNILNDLFSV